MAKPWLTSDEIVAAIKRKIAVPISQNTFSSTDILAFANEEMSISQVPSIMQYHEEYYVASKEVEIEDSISEYPIPERAIGMRLRDVFFKDSQDNLFEMTRIQPDDQAYFQRSIGTGLTIHKFYLQNNNLVLAPPVESNATGSLVFQYFLRPNQLVTNSRAATIESFTKTITIDNVSLVAGDTVTIDDQVFTADTDFAIGVDSTTTATNLKTAINTNGVATASSALAVVTLDYSDVEMVISTSNSTGFAIQTTQGITFDAVPSHIVDGEIIDFLQTNPGHQLISFDVTIPTGGVSGSTINFTSTDVPTTLVVGDYICSQHECIIPWLPPELHSGLAERTSARILAALGDQAGLGIANQKIAEIEQRQGVLVDQRVDGAPQKILSRHSLLRTNRMGSRRRF